MKNTKMFSDKTVICMDDVSEERRRNMRAVRCSGSRIETMMRKELWSRGLRYRKNCPAVFGKPDLAFIGKKVAVFCDSEFWHGYDWENRKNEIKTRREFWLPKIERNIRRDAEVTDRLRSEGWIVLRFWGKEIENNLKGCADIIERTLKQRWKN